MKSMSELYIDEIANSLVSGHAAILVGAGFSRNADPANDTVKSKMPMWNGLIDQFCEKLDIDEEHRKYLNTLTVAQEIEEAYGRPFLDDIIRKTMADDDYKPSDIHINLMSLPWSDVFTTNYDTLLERACGSVTDRQYQIIRDQKDLIYSAGKPRLIKLHGSFPSNGPFIITEEDFRKYPNDHAPFVNTVQQSLLENTFCLIGFSGDDPNFLKWIGWIHDNLGLPNSPMIYLITHKAFPKRKENSLLAKKIKVVVLDDVEQYQDKTIPPDVDEYHKELYRRFIKDLVNRTKEKEKKHAEWPGYGVYDLHNEVPSLKRLKEILKDIHSSYPGWIFAPFKQHEKVSGIIESLENLWADKNLVKNGKKEFIPEEKNIKSALKEDNKLSDNEGIKSSLEIMYEYCWLHNIIGSPFSSGHIKNIQSAVEEYESIPAEYRNKDLEKKYHYIYLTLLRAYRNDSDEENWSSLHDKISSLRLDTDEKNSLEYEEVYHNIYNLKFANLHKKINKINADNNQTIWALRKASLLAIIGKYQEAKDLLQRSINFIRYAGPGKLMLNDVRSRSIESCMVSLYNYIVQADRTLFRDSDSHENDFIDEVRKDFEFDFIWDQENEQYTSLLTDEYYYKPQTVTRHNYGIGSISFSTTFGRADAKDVLCAFEFLAFREATGIPYRLSYVVNKNGVLGAAKRLARYNIIYPIVLAILSQDDKIIENVWSRNYVARISTEAIDELVDACVVAFNNSLTEYLASDQKSRNNSLTEFPIYIIPEVLARLCSRCSSDKFQDILGVISSMYDADQKRRMPEAKDLVQDFIKCVPLDQLINNVDVFLNLSLYTVNTYSDSRFPECLWLVYNRFDNILSQADISTVTDKKAETRKGSKDTPYKIPINDDRRLSILRLFEYCKKDDYQRTAINRLIYASLIFEFTDEEQKTFESIILSPDNIQNGTPYIGYFLPSAINLFVKKGEVNLRSSGEEWTSIIDRIKQDCVPGEYTEYTYDLHTAIGFVQKNVLNEQQVIQLATVLIEFCTKLADRLSNNSFFDGFADFSTRNNLNESAQLMGEALLSADLADANKVYSGKEAIDLFNLFKACDTPRSLLHYCLNDENRNKGYLQDLLGHKKNYVTDAVSTLYALNRYGILIDEEVKNLLLNSILTAMGCDATPYVSGGKFIVRKNGYTFEQIKLLDEALPKFLDITSIDELDSEDSVSDKLLLRKYISDLAHTLYMWEEKGKKPITSGVATWKEINQGSQEFAEIRNCWDEFPNEKI